MKFDALFLDLDNTLYDYTVAHDKALKGVFDDFSKFLDLNFDDFLDLYNGAKFEIHRELIGTASSHNRAIYFQRLVEKTHKTISPSIVLDLYETYWSVFFENMRLFDGVLFVLDEIRKLGLKVAIVTNFTAQVQLRKIHFLGLDDHIDVLVSSEEAGNEKPHPSVFLMATNKLQILPSRVIMVGDNPINDVEGANYLGMTTVLFDLEGEKYKSVSYKSPLQKPDYIISDIRKLLKILKD